MENFSKWYRDAIFQVIDTKAEAPKALLIDLENNQCYRFDNEGDHNVKNSAILESIYEDLVMAVPGFIKK
jgi:hypothetical protein